MNTTSTASLIVRPAAPAALHSRVLVAALAIVLTVGLLVAAAHLRVFLPHSPVPITFQTLVVLLAGVALGGRLGTVAVACYLLLGLTGWPVFATPVATAGYLAGFLFVQPLLGWLTRPGIRPLRLLGVLVVADVVILACGSAWLLLWQGVWLGQPTSLALVLTAGVVPFIPGEALKVALAWSAGGGALRRVRPALSAAD